MTVSIISSAKATDAVTAKKLKSSKPPEKHTLTPTILLSYALTYYLSILIFVGMCHQLIHQWWQAPLLLLVVGFIWLLGVPGDGWYGEWFDIGSARLSLKAHQGFQSFFCTGIYVLLLGLQEPTEPTVEQVLVVVEQHFPYLGGIRFVLLLGYAYWLKVEDIAENEVFRDMLLCSPIILYLCFRA